MAKTFREAHEELEPEETRKSPAVDIPAGYELRREKVTKRVSLIMRESYYNKLEVVRLREGKQRNTFINDILEAYLDKCSD